MAGLTYRDAGVDIDAGDALVDRIRPLAARTRTKEVLTDIGGFAGLCAVPAGMRDPVLVSGTDGVGTKLELAFALDVHDTVGIDLVAMCVNDVVTTGARPLFFLDYFATGKLDIDRAESVVRGIARGCEIAECALLGGETAELPGFYAEGEYDLAGFCVGVVERDAILGPSRVRSGDVLVGVASSGLHSNGYSLARKALLEHRGMKLDEHVDALAGTLGAALLSPTRIYARAVSAAIREGEVHAFCHVTGGGLPGNLPRVMPDGLGARVDTSRLARPPIFDLVRDAGGVELAEMRRTFNLGVGLVAVVPERDAKRVTDALVAAGEHAAILGSVVDMPGAEDEARVVYDEG